MYQNSIAIKNQGEENRNCGKVFYVKNGSEEKRHGSIILTPFGLALAACGSGEGHSDVAVDNVRRFDFFAKEAMKIDDYYSQPVWLMIDSADLNNDGFSDIVVAPVGYVQHYERAYDPIVLISDSNFNFYSTRVVGDWDGVLAPAKIVISDINLDGNLDIVLPAGGYDAPPFPEENFAIFEQKDSVFTDLNIEYPTLYSSDRGDGRGSFFHSAAVGDLNHDGKPDIFMGDLWEAFIINGDDKAFISINELWDPSLYPSIYSNQVTASEIIDIIDDNQFELILGGYLITNQIIKFDSDYNIKETVELPENQIIPRSIVLGIASGDLNGDGLKDLVLTLSNEGYDKGAIQVLLQDQEQGFIDVTAEIFFEEPTAEIPVKEVALIDVDRDGDLDLVLGQTESWALHYYENVDNTFVRKLAEYDLEGWSRFSIAIDENASKVFAIAYQGDWLTPGHQLMISEVVF